jgi:hypothetical protein
VKGVDVSRQLATYSLDATEKAVKQGSELYLKAVEQLPVPFFAELAKTQVELTLRATGAVVKQSRELISR